jgi:hypothetical protein
MRLPTRDESYGVLANEEFEAAKVFACSSATREFPIFTLRDHAMIEKTGHDSNSLGKAVERHCI